MYNITSITHTEKEQVWQDETTRYWFEMEVDGESEMFAVADTNGSLSILDSEGHPLPESPLRDHLLRTLTPHYIRNIYE